MSGAVHTPGPWHWSPPEAAFHGLFGDGEMLLYYTTSDDGVWCFNSRDEPLIAAAPDMLEALELVEQFYGEDSDVFYAVRAAIAKAKGGAS